MKAVCHIKDFMHGFIVKWQDMFTIDKSTKSPVRTELLSYSVLNGQNAALLVMLL